MKILLKVLTVFMVTIVIGIFSLFFVIKSNYANSYESVDKDVYMKDNEKYVKKEKNKDKDKIAILLMGLEGSRTDTLVLALIDKKTQKINLISIPRDTYYAYEGYKDPARKKINAVYGYAKEKGGAEGVLKAVSRVTGVKVDQYIKVDYDGVKKIVDSLGGITVNIPFDMNYDDPYAKPPLHIHFKQGVKTLNGDEAIEFLRWRKNNRGYTNKNSNGDIGRVERQQMFMESALEKAISLKLPKVIKTGFENTKTNISFDEALEYFGVVTSIKDINSITIPGEPQMKDGLSYYIVNEEETKSIIKEIQTKKESN